MRHGAVASLRQMSDRQWGRCIVASDVRSSDLRSDAKYTVDNHPRSPVEYGFPHGNSQGGRDFYEKKFKKNSKRFFWFSTCEPSTGIITIFTPYRCGDLLLLLTRQDNEQASSVHLRSGTQTELV